MGHDNAVISSGAEFLVGDSEMAQLIRGKDWSETPLGPIDSWPQSLRTTVSLCLASNFPINIIWGPEHTQIYNDGYKVACGEGHPAFLGMAYPKSWESAWPAIGEPFEQALEGSTSFLENQRMFLNRNGYLEETFFTFSLSPIRDESGGIGGLFHPVTETTLTIVGERRTRAVRDLTARLTEAKTADEVFQFAIETLTRFDFDIPFLLLYEFSEENGCAYLRACSGLQRGSRAAPERIEVDGKAVWSLAELVASQASIEITGARSFFDGPCGPYPECPDTIFLVPIRSLGNDTPRLAFVSGASPRLPMTDAYRGLFDLIGAALSAALSRVEAFEKERQRVEALAAIDHAKTAFFSNVSHEFRTPLTLLLGPLEELIQSEVGSGAGKERLELAHRNALRLLKLVNSLLDFSRIEAGRSQGRFEATDLPSLTADLASNFRSAFEQAGLVMNVDCPPLPHDVYVDREMWEKIVLNLLSNAFKFTFEGSVSIRLQDRSDGVRFVVQDTGVGIEEEELPRVFERFHRIEGQRSRTFEGTGIGLALVEELVKLHGGTISVQSKSDLGTEFEIFIPYGYSHLPDVQFNLHSQPSTATRADAYVAEALRWLPDEKPDVAEEAQAASRPRIVLADDNADMRAYVTRILTEDDYDVVSAANGRAALELIKASPRPDLVLADVMMPEMDGFVLLKTLRADEETAHIPIILLSARAGQEARVEGLSAGADDYLVKPFSARELTARIGGVVALSVQRNAAAARELDLHEKLATEKGRSALRLSETRLQLALEAGQLGAWEIDLETGETARSTLHDRLFGYETPPEDWTFERFIEHVIPEDRGRVSQTFKVAVDQLDIWDVQCRVIRVDDQQRWLDIHGMPAVDADGKPNAIVGVVADITEQRQHEDQQKSLVNELNHRVKNTLSIIQSISLQLRKASPDVMTFGKSLEDRIIALSGAHDLLTRSSWIGASLRDVVSEALTPQSFADLTESRIEVSGPAVRLNPNAALSLNMAFHELATNALKFGALSSPSGKIEVKWDVDQAAEPAVIEIVWKESDGPAVSEPERRGFGSRMIETAVARELDGSIVLTFEPEGLICTMRLPISNKVELLANG